MVKNVKDEAEYESEDPRLNRDRDEPRADRDNRNSREFSNRDWEEANAPSDRARRRAFRERWAQTHLPNLPKKEGWHRFWCSTNHPTDTVARRIALGYKLLSLDQLAKEGNQWAPEQASVKDAGSADGLVHWREMVGMEIPEDLYQDYMREFHHDLPYDAVQDIYDPIVAMKERAEDAGGNVQIGSEWSRELAKFKRSPKQFE